MIGKWHLGSKPEWGPSHYGFDHSYGSLAGGVTSWSHRYKLGEYSKTWHRNGGLIEEEGHVTDLLTKEALRWIHSRRENPFFLYLPFTAVHLPINESEEWLAKVPKSITSEIERQYIASIMHLDDSVGRIVKALEEQGLRENTLLVFTSDNGGSTATNNTQPYPPDNSPPGKLPASNVPFRGQKGMVYEGGTRVPTFVSWPGKLSPRMISTPVSIIDWMPTFCQLAGYQASQDQKWDGTDLSKLLLENTPLAERALYIAGPRWQARSLRKGAWKLVAREKDGESLLELFNMAKDPSEATNLADGEANHLADLKEHLELMSRRDNDSVVSQ